MGIPSFTQGYPPDGSSLGQTKAVIRDNLDGTFLTVGVDHVNNNGQPGDNPAGYHTIIHQVPQTSVATVTGYNQVFSGVPGTLAVNAVTTPAVPPGGDTQLYTLSSLGVLSQLTGYSATAQGYAWVGGVLLQWGSYSAGGNGTAITFAIPFPKNCFSVVITVNSGSSVNSTIFVRAGSVVQASFITDKTGTSNYPIFFIAIGN